MNNGKIRIYELSKELNLDNKDIKDICEQLNIAVKSHSSTITSAQADRVKSVAVRYTSAAKTNGNNGNNNSKAKENKLNKPKVKRKQQVLAVHHKQPASDSAPQTPKNESGSPQLASPPKLVAPPRPLKDNRSDRERVEPATPNKPPQLKEPSKSETVTQDTTDTTNKNEKRVAAAKPPKLVEPPSRRQAKAAKETSVRPPSKPVRADKADDVEAPAPAPAPAKEAKPAKDKKTASPPDLPKLQKPPKLKTVDKPASDIEEEPNELLEPEEDTDKDEVINKTEVKKTRLKRPTPPRKTQEWVDEEEEESSKKSKLGKGKRRPKPIIDDDDDDFDTDFDNNNGGTAVSISTARPPKPEALQPKTAATSSKKPKKPTPKTAEKSSKVEKQTRKEVQTLPEKIVLTDNLTIRDLSERLNIPETDIIKNLFFKGIAVNITQTLDLDTARLVTEELGVEVETPEERSAATKETEMLDVDDLENLQLRPPVVTIMGHVDHGKTTLLDSIRKSKVAQGEAGGITQHIGAYHVDLDREDSQQQIVFLDTPGHEAFTAMRARGTRVTDIAILVVAADDGVQPQTKEAISHAKAAEVPIIVAINKIDKPEANPDRIMQELTEFELVPEDWGGSTPMVPVSALKGENLDELLEMILLVSEIEELSANPDRPAKGTIIEANLDRTRGPVATLLVQNGTLRVGDNIVAGSVLGKIRAMIDDRGNKVEAATPSFAVEILGLNEVPEAGDEFDVYPSEKEARTVADRRASQQRDSRLQQSMSSRRVSLSTLSAQAQEGELKELNLIVKADVQGSVEAILGSLQQLPQNEVQIRILLASPGEVTETDVDLAAASGAVIVGFNTTLASGARQAADREGVDIRQYNIIYKLLDEIQGAMEGLLDPEEVEENLGQAEVRAVFTVGRGSVAGCYVQSGKIVRNCRIRVHRGQQVVYDGNLDSLRRIKEDAKEVNAGYECGLGSAKFNDWQEGDIVEAYEMVFKRRTLAT
ncbi:translation initiation factor IF-2 [Myxosarcina sp. GI1]|uniref:translation initiation factor IF-2 n=1 Tax=Myxosarcina sp. GI1 TaxID=1541065 RepID=UPI00056B0D5C|nr:translation initiation factor IF-2 [Myxosarcina sp. GI1]